MKTQKEALSWIAKSVGKGYDTDGMYGYQCKDYSNAYSIYLGSPFKAGNAITLWTQSQAGWSKVKTPQAGDVFVMNYVADGVNYGHTGVVEVVRSSNFTSVDQNWYNASLTTGSKAARVTHQKSDVLGYLRPTYKKEEEKEVLELQPPVFNARYYLNNNPDVNKKYNMVNAKNHWLENGIKEGRASAPNFHVKEYLANYGDLQRVYGKTGYAKAVKHYFNNGINEGRSGRKLNPVVNAAQSTLDKIKALIGK